MKKLVSCENRNRKYVLVKSIYILKLVNKYQSKCFKKHSVKYMNTADKKKHVSYLTEMM